MNFTFKSDSYVSAGGKNLSHVQIRPEAQVPEGLFTDLQIGYLKHADILNTKKSSIPNFFQVVVERSAYSNLTKETIVGSLYDPAMGVPPMIGGLLIDDCYTCRRINQGRAECNLKELSCRQASCKGGHFGVIIFTKVKDYIRSEAKARGPQKPVKNYNKIFNPKEAPFTEAIRIASCVCNKCKTLILPKNFLENKNVLNTPELNRLALVEELTGRVGKAERACKCKTRDYVRTASREDGVLRYKEEGSKKIGGAAVTANEWYDTMHELEKSDSLKYLGYRELSDLDKCTLVGIPVPGIEMRPAKIINGAQVPHEYTMALSAIVEASNHWQEAIRRTKIYNSLGKNKFIGESRLRKVETKIAELEEEKANLLNDRTRDERELKDLNVRLGRSKDRMLLLKKIKVKFAEEWPGEGMVTFANPNNEDQMMRGLYSAVKKYADLVGSKFLTKKGIIRGEVNAKRSDFTARAVITPSSYRLDVVEVPEYIATTCGIQDTVTEANIAQYRVMLNQRKINHILSYRGGVYYPVYVTPHNIAAGLCRIQVGDKITRWLMDGDVALVNRQPSLHPGNMYAFYVKIVPHSTIGLPFPVTTPFAGDFDGDTVAITFPQSLEAREEAIRIAHSKKNVIGVRTGAPIMGVIYNALKSIYVMTSMEKLLPKAVFYDALVHIQIDENVFSAPGESTGGVPDIMDFKARCNAHGIHPLSGKALFSYLLPRDFNYPPDGKPNSRGVLIRNGILVKGAIKKQEISANIPGTIIHYLQAHYGWEAASRFIESGSLLGEYFSQHFASAMPASDCLGIDCDVTRAFVSSESEKLLAQIRELGPEPTDPYELELYNTKLSRLHQKISVINQNLYNKFAKESSKEEWKNYYAQIRSAYEKVTLATRDGDIRYVRQDESTRATLDGLVKKLQIRRLDFELVQRGLEEDTLSEDDRRQLVRDLRRVHKERDVTTDEANALISVINRKTPYRPVTGEILAKVEAATPDYPAIIQAIYNGETLTPKLHEQLKQLQLLIAQEYERLSNMDELTYNQFYLNIQAGTKGSEQEFGEMVGIVGQLSTSETLLAKDMSGGTRCSVMFRVDDPDPVSRGYIASNYVTGVTGDEKFQMLILQREAAAKGVNATPDAGVIEKELANSIGKYRTELGAITSETDHLLQLLAGDDGLGVYKSIEVNGVQLPFDPRVLVNILNAEKGWVKLPDGKWYRQHKVQKEVNGKIQEKVYYVKV